MAEAELFHNNKRRFDELTKIDENEEIELTLGLSLNGRFGVNPNRPDNAPLVRSSSVSNFIFSGSGGEADTEKITTETVSLGRTMSLPAGTEEDWRRRKEAQTIRRMEVRRKRVEKMMSEKLKIGGVRMARNRVVICERGVPLGNQLGSHQNGSTSKESDSESQITNQGANIDLETGSSNQNEQKPRIPVGRTSVDKQSTKSTNDEGKEMMKNMTADMPCVSTRGVGPSGKRIEGLLYRYSKGEEVKIVCVCHGSFLSPAEFVKHAGGGDVSNPMKHIVVNPSDPLI